MALRFLVWYNSTANAGALRLFTIKNLGGMTMRRRILTGWFWACLLACLLPALAGEVKATDGDIYLLGGDLLVGDARYFQLRCEITKLPDRDEWGELSVNCVESLNVEALSIPSDVELKIDDNDILWFHVTKINDMAFATLVESHFQSLKSVAIPDTVKSIGISAFADCGALETVSLGSGVESIGSYAFVNCKKLKTVTGGGSVTSLGDEVFRNTALTATPSFPKLMRMGDSVFSGCTSLTTVDYPTRLTGIPAGTFENCTSLTSFAFPPAVTTVHEYAFRGSGLTSLTIPASVTAIGEEAFYNCAQLTTATLIYDAAKDVNARAFSDNTTVTHKLATPGPTWLSWLNNCYWKPIGMADSYVVTFCKESGGPTFSLETSETVLDYSTVNSLFQDSTGDDYTITVKAQGSGYEDSEESAPLFIGKLNAAASTPPTLSNFTVTRTGKTTALVQFATDMKSTVYCEAGQQASPDLPNTNAAGYMFLAGACSIEVEGLSESGGNYLFLRAENDDGELSGITKLDVLAWDPSLEFTVTYDSNGGSGTVPAAQTAKVGTGITISDGSSLGSPYENATFWYWNTGADGYGTRYMPGETMVVKQDLTLYAQWGNLYSWIELEDGTVEITGYHGTAAEVTIPDTLDGKTVTSLGSKAFANLDFLTSVTLPSGLVTVGNHAFQDCDKLTTMNLNSGLTHIGEGAFEHLDALETITFPDSLAIIGPWAFANCRKLTNLQLPQNLEIIYYCAFIHCYGLTDVTIPDSVTSVGRDAFRHCKGLKTATLGAKVSSLGHRVFDNCPALETVTLGKAVKTIPVEMFRDCDSLQTIHYVGTMQDWRQVGINETSNNALFAADFTFENGAVQGGYWGDLLYGYAAASGTVTVLPPHRDQTLTGTVHVGSYTAQGKLLDFAPATSGSAPVATGAAKLRLFLLDGNYIPLQAALTCSLPLFS